MIGFKTQAKDGRELFAIGLSAENVRRCLDGTPVHVDLAEYGGDCHVVIDIAPDLVTIIDRWEQQGLVFPPDARAQARAADS